MAKLRDWTQLPSDLLQEIASHFTEIPDLIRFHSVCVHWRSIPIPPKLPQQLPWLLLPPPPKPYNVGGDFKVRFLSLSENRTYAIPLPEFCNHYIFTSPHGWLIAVSDEGTNPTQLSISLVNPITRSSIPLPPLHLPHHSIPQYSKAKLFQSDDGGYDLVLAFRGVYWFGIFFCCPGKTAWRNIYVPVCSLGDFVVHNGCLFVFHKVDGHTDVFDMKTLDKVSHSTRPPDTAEKLVASPSGDLLLVGRCKLFRWLGESEEKMKWVEVSGIGGYTLFYSHHQTMCLGLSDFKGCRGNCIYFVKDICNELGTTVWLCDIGEGCVQHDQVFRWGCCRGCPYTMWFVPSLC